MKTIVDARQVYQDTSVRGANPIELVVLLYDSAIADMRLALTAMQKSDIEGRSTCISHALMILQQLQGTLDFERGGAAARQFEQFYNLTRAKVLEAQMRGSSDMMQQQIRSMSEVRDCWLEARRLLATRAAVTVESTTVSSDPARKSEWSA
jgi:flagellar secretion chaperone FliS